MDHGERIAKAETAVDALVGQLGQIQMEQVRTREALDKLRDHTDQRFYEMQQNSDRRFAEQREYTERGFSEIRSSMNEIRKEHAIAMRWLTGLTVTTALSVIALLASVLVRFN